MAFDLWQGERNASAPRANPLSSRAPTLVFRPEDQPWLALGSPGGSRIPSGVLQGLQNRLVHRLNLAFVVGEPRMHSQLWPDVVGFEQGGSPDTQRQLEPIGSLRLKPWSHGATNTAEQLASSSSDRRGSLGMSDPRHSAGPAMGEFVLKSPQARR